MPARLIVLVALVSLALASGGDAAVSLRAPNRVAVLSTSDTSARISWRDRSRGETRFEIEVRGGGTTRVVRSGRRQVRLTGLREGVVYRVRVRACRRARCGSYSRSLRLTLQRGPTIGGCPVFPADNAWNRDVSRDPVDPRSDAYVRSIGLEGNLHPDFGGDGEYGIPFVVVPPDQPRVPTRFTEYPDESDPGPYPIPLDAPVENGGDKHVLVVRQGECRLYELFDAARSGDGWRASNGAVFNLRSNALRPAGWTSADAAGLPILPGLVRYDEVAAGAIRHALRFTVRRSQRAYVSPARHYASSSTDPDLPPMGLRLRLKASYPLTGFSGQSRVILEALKRYGMFVADNGSDWYVTGAADRRWDDDDLRQIKRVPGSAFEVVRSGPLARG